MDRRLGDGKLVTFESGSGANRNKLTGSYIYNDDVGSKEGGSSGARGRTSSIVAARL